MQMALMKNYCCCLSSTISPSFPPFHSTLEIMITITPHNEQQQQVEHPTIPQHHTPTTIIALKHITDIDIMMIVC